MKRTQALHDAGQSIWLDNITRALLDRGILDRYIARYSVTGLTSNPTILDNAIKEGTDYDTDIAAQLRKRWNTDFDDASAIGRRYRRQDEIGTPFCVTVDFDSLNDQAVTVRERDTMGQDRIAIDSLESYLSERLPGC